MAKKEPAWRGGVQNSDREGAICETTRHANAGITLPISL